MLKLMKLQKDQVKAVLLDLSESFPSGRCEGTVAAQVDVTLFEFVGVDERVLHPAMVVRTAESVVRAL
jgi:hypothetical protein